MAWVRGEHAQPIHLLIGEQNAAVVDDGHGHGMLGLLPRGFEHGGHGGLTLIEGDVGRLFHVGCCLSKEWE